VRLVPAEELICGLDIGTTEVCAVIGEYNEQGMLEITGVGTCPSSGLRKGVVVNIEAAVKSVMTAIEAAEMMSGREVFSVFTGIAGGHIEGINSRGVVAVTGKGREITQADIDRVIDAAKAIVIPMDRDVLHVIPQEYIVDEQGGIKDPRDMIGVRLEAEVHIITVSVTSAQNLVKCINRARFKVNEIVLESLAASKAVLSSDEKELGVMLIDLGGGTTDILVYLEGTPYYTNVIPVGAAQVTSDLSIVLKTPLETAEKIKREAGCCFLPLVSGDEQIVIPGVGGRPAVQIPRKEIARIIQPRMEEIFSMVRDQVDKKGILPLLGGGVVLTGGGAMLPGACELASEIFQQPVRVGYPARVGGLVDQYAGPAFATAVGLVLYGAEKAAVPQDQAAEPTGDGPLRRIRKWLKEFF